jgi:ribosomal protein L33
LNSSAVSPKGDYVARFIYRDVGATAPTASVVMLSEISNESSDVLKQGILSIKGKVNVEIKWTDEYELAITMRCREGDEKEYIKKENYKNVQIRYKYDPSL